MVNSTQTSGPLQALSGYVASYGWGPLLSVSRSTVLSLLSRIQVGHLGVTDVDGKVSVYGQKQVVNGKTEKNVYSLPNIELTVHKDVFWVRMLLFADMLFILNRNYLSNGSTLTSNLSAKLTYLLRKTNTLTTARLNIAAHYDISNDMFAAFLSPDMTYSCPIWLPKSDPGSSEETLEQAQMRKLRRFITNAKIKEDDHVLEIGTGWGSFAILAVKETGCRVTSLTLSTEQKALAEQRIAEAGFTDRIEVLLCDYRALPTPRDGKLYDKVVSIEMLEAVGKEYLDTYFQCVDKLLKPEGGVAVFQCITMPESRYDAYSNSDDFIRRYIFPGGHLPTITQLLDSVRAGSSCRLIPESVENIGPHYAKTLRLWREEFMQNFEEKIKPSLLEEHEGMTDKDVDLFRRKWEYYFAYCEAGFVTKTLGDSQGNIILWWRQGAQSLVRTQIYAAFHFVQRDSNAKYHRKPIEHGTISCKDRPTGAAPKNSVLKGHFVTLEADEEQGIHAARGFACEAVATRFIIGLADREIIDSLLYELEIPEPPGVESQSADDNQPELASPLTEQSPLLSRSSLRSRGSYRSRLTIPESYDGVAEDPSDTTDAELADQFDGLNALEIAAVSGAKKFLCQKQVQRIINAIWTGDIMFWSKLSADAQKKAQIYQRKSMDPFCRLRVPIYLKAFEVLFFVAFLAFYYAVLMQRSFYSVTTAEVFLYIWIASFAHNEIGEFWDAGMIGLHQGNDRIIDTSFDILALEALFLIPRICSPLLSLSPYFGTLLPCLTVMTKDFLKFLSLVAIFRIVVLKMTHLPHVLLINLYEKMQSVRKGNTTGFGFGFPRGVEKPPGWRRSALNKRLPSRYPLLAPSPEGVDQSPASPSTQPSVSTAAIKDIKAVLDQLTTQIEQLRGVVEEQERRTQVNDDQ
ncbi:cyclopropane-fatty-acyl-phospholipid synthase [Aureobasidium subglaciale]|nr:cyclopropane-fatty-acyl-phospholipid synthase [Aureobasidium subglaciale]